MAHIYVVDQNRNVGQVDLTFQVAADIGADAESAGNIANVGDFQKGESGARPALSIGPPVAGLSVSYGGTSAVRQPLRSTREALGVVFAISS
jgi:hypothetical protein